MSSLAIPSPHRVDRFRHFGTAILIYAASIDPDPINQLDCALLFSTVPANKGAEVLDLRISLAMLILSLEHILVGSFIRAPTMRGYKVGRDVLAVKLLELQRVDIEEAHGITETLEALTTLNVKV